MIMGIIIKQMPETLRRDGIKSKHRLRGWHLTKRKTSSSDWWNEGKNEANVDFFSGG